MRRLLPILLLIVGVVALFVVYRRWQESRTAGDGGAVREKLELRTRFQSGLELARRLQLERALNDFEACLKLDPEHAEAHFQRGRILLAQGRNEEGMRALHEGLRLAPRDVRFHRFLMDLFMFSDPVKDRERSMRHFREIQKLTGRLIDFDLQLTNELLTRQSLDSYGVAASMLRSRRESLSPDLVALHEAFFPGGVDNPAIQGLPGFSRFHEIFKRCPALHKLKEAVAERLVNPSRLGLPPVEDGRIPGSTLPLEISQSYFEELIDYAVFDSSRMIDLGASLAILTMKMGDYSDAVARFERLFEFELTPAVRQQNVFYLALCHYKLEQYDVAQKYFLQLRAAQPQNLLVAWFLHLMGGGSLPFREAQLPAHLAGLRFTDVAGELGCAKRDAGGSSGWADHDGDGDLDLFVSGCDTYSILYRNEGGRFVDGSIEAGLGEVASGFSNVFVDYDSDGDADLFVARDGWAGPAPNSLYRNEGDGTFTDVSRSCGLRQGRNGSSFTSSWADFDRDGDLDLFVANGVCGDGSTIELYDNQGNGTFSAGTRERGLAEPAVTRTIGCAVGDYDLDGWPDIFVSGLEPTPNRLYRNRGDGTFEEQAARAGVDDAGNPATGFVAFIADLSGDGLPDIFMTKWEPDFRTVLYGMMRQYQARPELLRNSPRYFRNRGDGTFDDVSEAAGFLYPHGTMGAGLADLNNDGYLDVYLANGGPALERLEPDSLYVNVGGERFVEAGRRVGMGHIGKGHGVSFADFDRDGDIDMYCPLGGAFHGDFWTNVLYRNDAEKLGHWLLLDLVGTESHRMAIGAQVSVRAGDLTVFREKKCGVGFGASDSPYLHFGLGTAARADSLTIRWPSGKVDRFENVAADRFLRLKEGMRLETARPAGVGGG